MGLRGESCARSARSTRALTLLAAGWLESSKRKFFLDPAWRFHVIVNLIAFIGVAVYASVQLSR